jgi:MFS family permease
VTLTVSLAILVVNFGTSIVSPGLSIIAEEFNVSVEVSILAISLYLIGFAAGPLFAAPLSEEYGRNALYIPFMVVFILLQIGVARAQTIGGLLALRFLSGVAVSPPATLGAGTITDVLTRQPADSRYGILGWNKLSVSPYSLSAPLSARFSVPLLVATSLRTLVGDGRFGYS